MKALNLTKTLTTIAVMATISFSSVVKSEEMSLPVISKPAILEEGTQRVLTKDQIAELLPWAKNSKIFLNDLLDNIQGLSTTDKIDRLVEGIQSTVGESAPKNSELLMRYALNRGLVLNEILSREMSDDVVGTQDAKLRVLKSSIQIALKYYDTDMQMLSAKTAAPFVIFGLDYFAFLSELNKSVFDASAQYAIQRTALEWLQWDLYRDLNNASYAPQIVKINNGLKTFPTKKLTDAQSIAYIRQMKAVAGQLRINETLQKVKLEKQMAQAKTAEERQAITDRIAAETLRLEQEAQLREINKMLEGLNNGKAVALQTLTSGDIVIYSETFRTVNSVTDDGLVILTGTYSYNQVVVRRAEVEKAFSNYIGLNSGNTVLYGNSIRTISYIGERGSLVLAGTYSVNQAVAKLGEYTRTVQSAGKYTVGDRVLYDNNIRTIQALDAGGRLVLTGTYSYNQAFVTVNQVSKVN
ncbi:MAG: hypothetical protein H7177_10325 [Rhizobacter sp.]|nr:hypothetical protein [Bacteriovorax sp.]